MLGLGPRDSSHLFCALSLFSGDGTGRLSATGFDIELHPAAGDVHRIGSGDGIVGED